MSDRLDVILSRNLNERAATIIYQIFCDLSGVETDYFSYLNGVHFWAGLYFGEVFGTRMNPLEVAWDFDEEEEVRDPDNIRKVKLGAKGFLFFDGDRLLTCHTDETQAGLWYDVFCGEFGDALIQLPDERSFRNAFNFMSEIVYFAQTGQLFEDEEPDLRA